MKNKKEINLKVAGECFSLFAFSFPFPLQMCWRLKVPGSCVWIVNHSNKLIFNEHCNISGGWHTTAIWHSWMNINRLKWILLLCESIHFLLKNDFARANESPILNPFRHIINYPCKIIQSAWSDSHDQVSHAPASIMWGEENHLLCNWYQIDFNSLF